MELNLKNTPISSLVEALNTVSEQPVDIDFTLPDYCPDIEKILRCKITPKIYNRGFSGGQLHVEGASVITILYEESENATLRVCEQSQPFSADFKINDLTEDYAIMTSAKCEYVNCRALSRRRLTVHGAFSLYVKAVSKGEITLYTPDDMENIEFKTENIKVSALSALSDEQFSVADEIQITGKPPVELIADSDVKVNITDYKIIPDKLMLSGEMNVRILYLSDIQSGKPEHIDYIIPFSQVIDCAGLSDDCVPCVNLTVLSYDAKVKSDILSENPLVYVDARLCASVIGYTSYEMTIATDAYSTELCSEPECARVTVPAETMKISDSIMQKDTLAFEDLKISELIDFIVSLCPLTTNISGGKLMMNSKANVSMLAYDSQGSPVYIERAVDICRDVELDESFNTSVCSDLTIASVSYRLGDENTVDLRCELKYSITLQSVSCLNPVRSVNTDDSKPLSKNTCALTLYYADKGESVWQIAKNYKTKQTLITSENDLSSEILEEPLMLLIPTV